VIDRVAGAPEEFVAQEMVRLSTHPTVADGVLAPRHVDLRPFVISAPGRTAVMRGGLTRFGAAPGEMIVNSSQGGGGKDTWVLPG
jgi:carboxylate-amine ligase